jgi:hypothetical protein
MFAVSRSFKSRLRSDGALTAKIDDGVVSYEHQTPLQYISGGAVLGQLSEGFRGYERRVALRFEESAHATCEIALTEVLNDWDQLV